jgi:hypothetical protein
VHEPIYQSAPDTGGFRHRCCDVVEDKLPDLRLESETDGDRIDPPGGGFRIFRCSYLVAKNFFSGGWGGALFHLTMRGDATAVDLGGGQFLFAILAYEHSQEPRSTGVIALKLLGDENIYQSSDSFKRVQAARGRGPIVLPQKLYPRFMRFRDIKDSTTAELVDPDNLAKSFGPGVRLVRVTIEITDEAVTRGIRNILPWLSRQVGWFRLNADDPNMPPLGPANFIDIDTL